MNRRIFTTVLVMLFLFEGAKGLWRQWGIQNSQAPGLRGAAARDVVEVTG